MASTLTPATPFTIVMQQTGIGPDEASDLIDATQSQNTELADVAKEILHGFNLAVLEAKEELEKGGATERE